MVISVHLLKKRCLIWISTCFYLASPCKQMPLHARVYGAGCAWDTPVTLVSVEEHECVLRCLSHKTCTAVNYDVQKKFCTLSETPCPVVETQPNIHYQILTTVPVDACVQWVATKDWNNPRVVKVNRDVGGDHPVRVVRLRTDAGDVLPAKWPNNGVKVATITRDGITSSSVFEVMLVNKACSLRWVYYDASSSDPLPTGAIQGGQWADGTPLYVAVCYATAYKRVIGYYNHAIRNGTYEYGGVHFSQNISLLIVA